MKIALLSVLMLFVIISLSGFAQAQTSLSDLRPEHQHVVEQLLQERSYLRFVSEREFGVGRSILQETRAWLKQPAMHPYYVRGDFNGDRLSDFAVILRDTRNLSRHMREDDMNHAVFVFNGQEKGRYLLAHESTETAFRQGFLYTEHGLRFMVSETDRCNLYVPAGRHYKVEGCWAFDEDY